MRGLIAVVICVESAVYYHYYCDEVSNAVPLSPLIELGLFMCLLSGELDSGRSPLPLKRRRTLSRTKPNSGHVPGIGNSGPRPRRTKGLLTKPLHR